MSEETNVTVVTSKKFTLNWQDFLKSLVIASVSAPLLIILTSIAAGHFQINWVEEWHLAASSAAAYLLKNLFSESHTVIAPPPPGLQGVSKI